MIAVAVQKVASREIVGVTWIADARFRYYLTYRPFEADILFKPVELHRFCLNNRDLVLLKRIKFLDPLEG